MNTSLEGAIDMAHTAVHPEREVRSGQTRFMWLEITGSCQLECSHCYASSGPGRGHGSMTQAQWEAVISDAADSGVVNIQFIGGEPTAHPALPALVTHALSLGLGVEVFSNLYTVHPRMWSVFERDGVTLATSYYSTDPRQHDAITGRVGSYRRTKANIAEAVRRGVGLRVGLIRLSDQQDVEAASTELQALGVPASQIGGDDLRGVGRGRDTDATVTESELCGNCANGVVAVMPDGTVQPCVFSRDSRFKVGDLNTDSLATILGGQPLREVRGDLEAVFQQRLPDVVGCEPLCTPRLGACDPVQGPCGPDCLPNCWPGCQPNCGPACSPACVPMGNCNPALGR